MRDLATGEDLTDVIEGTAGGVAWSADSSVLFYTVLDDAMRPWQLLRHLIGTDPADDVLAYQEDDERFFIDVDASLMSLYCSSEMRNRASECSVKVF